MRPRNYTYKDIDGNHWPDSALGDSLYYSIDISKWLNCENDNLVSVNWIVPDGLFGEDASENDTEVNIKLTSEKRGSFTVRCELTTEEDGEEQLKVVPVVLKVY